MNTRRTFTSAIIGGLAALVMNNCTPSSNDTKPDPKPVYSTQIENTSFTYDNLDNPGSHTFMEGDRSELKVSGTVYATKDGVRTTDTALISGIVANLGYETPTGITQVSKTGSGLPTLTLDELVPVALKNQTTQTATPTATINARGPPTGTDYTNYTFNVTAPTVTVGPAQDFIYQAANANPKILANIDQFAELLSHGRASDNKFYSPAEWKAFLLLMQDGTNTSTNREAVSYNVSFISGAVKINQTFGYVELSTLPHNDLYSSKKILEQ